MTDVVIQAARDGQVVARQPGVWMPDADPFKALVPSIEPPALTEGPVTACPSRKGAAVPLKVLRRALRFGGTIKTRSGAVYGKTGSEAQA